MAGAAATAVELAISGTVPLGTVLPAMLGVHALIGIGEAVDHRRRGRAVLASRPDLVALDLTPAEVGAGAACRARSPSMKRVSLGLFVVLALALAVGLGGCDLAVRRLLAGRPREGRREQGLPRGRPPARAAGERSDPRLRLPRNRQSDGSPPVLAGFVGTLIVAAAGAGLALLAPAPNAWRSGGGSPGGSRVSGHRPGLVGLAGNPASPIHRLDPQGEAARRSPG